MGGALAVVEALKRLGRDITRDRFLAELENIHGFDPGIQASPMTFSAENHAGVSSGAMIHLSDGKSVVVSRFPASDN
jgi:branched-chain amino acid transport system substrate-binding protein